MDMASRAFQAKLLTTLEHVSRLSGESLPAAFQRWLEFMILSIPGERARAEASVRQGLRRAQDGVLEAFQGLGQGYLQAVESSPLEDLLGPAYMELASRGGRAMLGQYFTPGPVGEAMARMVVGTHEEDRGRPYLTALEPCSGGGVLVLKSQLARQDAGLQAPLVWVCIDLDLVCTRLTAVQLAANRIPAVVLQADFLRFPSGQDGGLAPLVWPPLPDWPQVSMGQVWALVEFLGNEAATGGLGPAAGEAAG